MFHDFYHISHLVPSINVDDVRFVHGQFSPYTAYHCLFFTNRNIYIFFYRIIFKQLCAP